MIKELGKKILGNGIVLTIRHGHLKGKKYRLNKYSALAPLFGGWEKDSQRVFEAFVGKNDVVYDLGANTGIHSLHFSKLVGPGGLVYAVEPMPYNLVEIALVIKLNQITNIEVVPKAVSNESGSSRFAVGHHTKAGSLEMGLDNSQVVQVPVATIDELVDAGLRPPDFLKIDIEGAEGAALEGMDRTAAKHHPTMYIELHNPEQDIRVGKFLAKHGYAAYRLRTEQAVQLTGQVNFLKKVPRLDVGFPQPEGLYSLFVAVHEQRRSQWQTALQTLSEIP
jgi:FkbM family methyltransferase